MRSPIEASDLTAVILCGGRGERLQPFTDHYPKPLVPLGGKPLIGHLLEYLQLQGLRRFTLCVGYKADRMRRYVESELEANIHVALSDAGEDASILERIVLARSGLAGPVLVCYGDTIANVSVSRLCAFHHAARRPATVTVHRLRSPFGVVEVEDGAAVGFREKPILPYFINIGYFLLEDEALRRIGSETQLERWLSGLSEAKALSAYLHEGKHLTVNTEKERKRAESELIELYTL